MTLFRFANPIALWGLLPVAIFALVLYYNRGRGRFVGLTRTRALIVTVAFVFCVLGLSRPQGGKSQVASGGGRSEVVLAVDVSKSMLAEDVPPSRLAFSVSFVRALLRELAGARISVFPFALDSYVLVPFTDDADAALQMISSLNPNYVQTQGTDLGKSLESIFTYLAQKKEKRLARGETPPPTQVVLLSDGESHRPVEQRVLDVYRTTGIPVFSVGIGTEAGAPILVERGIGSEGEALRDPTGRTVHTKLVESTLRQISSSTKGEFFKASLGEVGRLKRALEYAQKWGTLSSTFRVDREFFPLCFLIAFLLFLTEFSLARWDFALRVLLPFLALAGPPTFAEESDVSPERQLSAEENAIKNFDEGVDELKSKNLQKSGEKFHEASNSPDPVLRKKALFNLGNSLLRQMEPEQALEVYQQAYDLSTGDSSFDREANRKISDNMALAAKVIQQAQEQSGRGKDKKQESGGDPKDQPDDPKGPQQFKMQNFSEGQKKKLFDVVAAEEQQTLQRIQENRNRKATIQPSDKPW